MCLKMNRMVLNSRIATTCIKIQTDGCKYDMKPLLRLSERRKLSLVYFLKELIMFVSITTYFLKFKIAATCTKFTNAEPNKLALILFFSLYVLLTFQTSKWWKTTKIQNKTTLKAHHTHTAHPHKILSYTPLPICSAAHDVLPWRRPIK
jgi:hypothetical protein